MSLKSGLATGQAVTAARRLAMVADNAIVAGRRPPTGTGGGVITMADLGDHDADLGDHDQPNPSDHDGPIRAITMVRRAHLRV